VALLALRPDSAPLPWADGVRYLGRDTDVAGAAPTPLLVPTDLAPTVPVALLYRAVRLRHPDAREPLAAWPADPAGDGGLRVLSLYEARALDRTAVAAAYARLLAAAPAGQPREGGPTA
jgi:hypothetical protein